MPSTPCSAEAPVQTIALSNAAGLQVQFSTLSATWLSCSVPMGGLGRRELLLGCADATTYLQQPHYIGATVGRFTNRLRDARFLLDGRSVQLVANNGAHQLHGGPDGFHRRVWQVLAQTPRQLRLGLHSPDGDQGFPGAVDVQATFTLGEGLSLDLRLQATTSAPCPVCLTQHAYFNLDGDQGGSTPSCLNHRLQVQARHWLPVDGQGLPLGELADVAGTGLDLRQPRCLADAIESDAALHASQGMDHSLSLAPRARRGAVPAAVLHASDGRVRLQLSTDQPALQVYTGNHLSGAPARDGRPYVRHAGIALEPQFLPDSPNHPVDPPAWPDCILRPGQVWRSLTRYTIQTAV